MAQQARQVLAACEAAPADAVPLRFGDNSYYPHLAAAEARGLTPTVVQCPGIGLDIDTPEDFAALEATRGTTRTHALLATWRAAVQAATGAAG